MIKPPDGWLLTYTVFIEDLTKKFDDLLFRFATYVLDTVEHLILALFVYITACFLLYLCTKQWPILSYDRGMRHARRILFIIAHPDDECMFFGPVILHYTQQPNCEVYLMCLTTGRNNGMGSIRKEELYKSCKILGIKECNILVHNHTSLPDSMDIRWPTELASKLILHHVDSLDISTIITFDRYGVSGHVNHCSIYYAIANLIIDRQLPHYCGVYVLESVNIIRKYWLILDLPLTLILSRFRFLMSFKERWRIHKAMQQHKSQLVWFRHLYMYFTRYMLISTLEQINLVDIELDLVLDD